METMERKKPRPPPVFHAGVQGEIVERCRAGDRTAGQVARDFDLTETAVRAWVAGAETERRGSGHADQRGAGLSGFRG
jgi:transposase